VLRSVLAPLGAALAVALFAGCVLPPETHWVPETLTVERVDYTGWDGLLRDHVRDGAVDYPAMAADPRLGAFVDDVHRSRFTRDTTRDERLAFLINGYNALVIHAVLRGGSPASLGGRYAFFMRTRHPIAAESITLYDLENRRIRSYDEPRIHFALVCASASCPKLRSEAYRPERLDDQLEAATRAFVNDESRNRFHVSERRADVSKIFDWYEEDFTAAHGSLGAYLSRIVDDASAAAGLAGGGWKLRFLPYDWSLNGAAPPTVD